MAKAEKTILAVGLAAVALCLAIIFLLDHRVKVRLEAAAELARLQPSSTHTPAKAAAVEEKQGAQQGAHPFIQIINQAMEEEDQQDGKARASPPP